MSTADKIKNFFRRKKSEAKFKVNKTLSLAPHHKKYIKNEYLQVAGPGRRLDSTEPSTSKPSKKDPDAYVPPSRDDYTEEAK